MSRRQATVNRVWVPAAPADRPIVLIEGRLAQVLRRPWTYLVAIPLAVTVAFAGMAVFAVVAPAVRTADQIASMESLAAAALPAGGDATTVGYTGGWANRSAYAYASFDVAAERLMARDPPDRVREPWRLVSATCEGPRTRCYLNRRGDLVLTVTFRSCLPPDCRSGQAQVDAVVSRQGPNAR